MSNVAVSGWEAIKATAMQNTGFELPVFEPPIGVQIDILFPFSDVYETSDLAQMIYLGGEELFINSSPTGERYHFNGADVDYTAYKKNAIQIRDRDRLKRVLSLYNSAQLINPQTDGELIDLGYQVPELTGLVNGYDEYCPIPPGELKRKGDSIIQAFYTPLHKNVRTSVSNIHDIYLEIVAVRKLEEVEPIEYTPRLPFCLHVHRLKLAAPIVWVVGFENAVKALHLYPNFTVQEAFNLDHLFEAYKDIKHHFYGFQQRLHETMAKHGQKSIHSEFYVSNTTLKEDHLVALTADQIEEFCIKADVSDLSDLTRNGLMLVNLDEVQSD